MSNTTPFFFFGGGGGTCSLLLVGALVVEEGFRGVTRVLFLLSGRLTASTDLPRLSAHSASDLCWSLAQFTWQRLDADVAARQNGQQGEPNSLPEFMNLNFSWEDHFSGKYKV